MKVYSVTEFREEINELLGQVTVAIQGDVCDFHIAQNRFVWFSLKDDNAVVPCFALTFQLQVALENGMEIRAVGSPTVFKKGQFVFKPRQIELVGQGSLQKAFELLKAKLTKEGLFDQQRKRALPRFPRSIGLVTSADAAAYSDVLRILKNRWSGLEIVHANVNVQGVQAVASIVDALQNINRFHSDLDALILTRGGGSLEDLQAFNTEEVVRAIFASHIPVVCAVGHERDVTLSDLVADVRASTPSNAAEMVVPDKRDVHNELSAMARQGEHALRRLIQKHADSVGSVVTILDQRARSNSDAFERLAQRLYFALHTYESKVMLSSTRLDYLLQLLQSVNPLHVLKRGYTMTLDQNGKIVRSATDVRAGAELVTRFSNGDIHSTVQ